jgi:hypothetical protein
LSQALFHYAFDADRSPSEGLSHSIRRPWGLLNTADLHYVGLEDRSHCSLAAEASSLQHSTALQSRLVLSHSPGRDKIAPLPSFSLDNKVELGEP